MEGKSTQTQLLTQYQTLLDLLCYDDNVEVLYLDFSKAFDRVDHALLLRKLINLGLGGKLLGWLRAFLEGMVFFGLIVYQRK